MYIRIVIYSKGRHTIDRDAKNARSRVVCTSSLLIQHRPCTVYATLLHLPPSSREGEGNESDGHYEGDRSRTSLPRLSVGEGVALREEGEGDSEGPNEAAADLAAWYGENR